MTKQKSIGKLQREFTTTSETGFFCYVSDKKRDIRFTTEVKDLKSIFVTTQDHQTGLCYDQARRNDRNDKESLNYTCQYLILVI